MYKPKSTKQIYIESLSINFASIENSLLTSRFITEIRSIIDFVSKAYRENVDRIVKLCDDDIIALESVPSSSVAS